MTTEEFTVIGAWMSGYYNAKRNNTMIDVKQLATNSKKVVGQKVANAGVDLVTI